MTGHKVLMPAGDWLHRGACVGIDDPDLFFPVGENAPPAKEIEAAKSVCRSCPVRSECLSWALATHQRYGVWGGMSEQERESLIRRPHRPPPMPKSEKCDECGVRLTGQQRRYCSEEHSQRGRNRQAAKRKQEAGVA